MRINGRTIDIDWGHLAVVTSVAAVSLLYLFDARATSLNIQNLLLVQPTVLLILILYILVLPQCIRIRPAEQNEPPGRKGDKELTSITPLEFSRILAIMAALGAFSFLLEIIGFDVATFLFVFVAMVICGERKPINLVLFPTALTLFVIYSLRALVTFPMPTAII